MRKLNDQPLQDDVAGAGTGSGSTWDNDRAGMPASIVEAHHYICNEDGGHLVDCNPCPKHHSPTTPYGAD